MLSSFKLHFYEGLWEKFLGEYDFSFKFVSFGMSFDKDYLYFSEFIVD